MDYFDKLSSRVQSTWRNLVARLKVYFKRLLFPTYLFPFKIVTYTVFYLVKFLIKLLLAFVGLIIDCLVYPFKSLKNFLKSIFIVVVSIYLLSSLFVTLDYLRTQYGQYGKLLCSVGTKEHLQNSVVRVVGGYSEGSGFFISENQVITNFHVISDEPAPKIIFPDGSFVTPIKILGDREADLAVLITEESYPDKVLPLPDKFRLAEDEPVLAAGYPLGTELVGKATVMRGNFVDFRKSSKSPVVYLQTSISLVEGMSGGPITDQCGSVIGINTMSLAGLSLYISADQVKSLVPSFTDQEITKIEVDPAKSPEEAVKAYYTYIKARRMQDGFNLLSREYLQQSGFEEWNNRFKDILDVEVIKSERYENTADTVFVKFSTKNWVDGEAVRHYFEGTWTMVLEDGVYKIKSGNILEVGNPGTDWFYN